MLQQENITPDSKGEYTELKVTVSGYKQSRESSLKL